MSKYKSLKNVSPNTKLKIAQNTFLNLFRKADKNFLTLKEAWEYIKKPQDIREKVLMREVNILSVGSVGDPYFELLGFIRDNQFIKKK